jgi:hypothetical protein
MEPKLIANFNSGLNQYFKPWLAPEDAFEVLDNAYLFRGNLRKREGFFRITQTENPLGGPVMGLITREDPETNEKTLVAFNQTHAFELSGNNFVDISGATSWTGNDSNFFWGVNAFDALHVVNDVDPIRYYNQADGVWYDLNPLVNASTTLDTALIVVTHRQRLIALNTIEGGVNYGYRARWSQIANPYATGTPPSSYVLSADAWRDDIRGRGNFIDAPTGEAIVSCGFHNDNLIVFFERSTWRLRYTGQPLAPFDWERINSQIGSESTFGLIPFDDGVVSLSRRGIIKSNSNQTARIDAKIPDIAVSISGSGIKKVHGARDFFRNLSLFAYPDGSSLDNNNNKILVHNHEVDAWSTFDLPVSCLSNSDYEQGVIWDNADFDWDSPIAQSITWSGTSNAIGNPFILAGTHDGNVIQLFSGTTDGGISFGFDIWTKRFMPYGQQGLKSRVHFLDLYLTGTDLGEITVSHLVDESTVPCKTVAVPTSSNKDTKYYRVYLGAIGRTHQFRLTLSQAQLNSAPGSQPFELQAMILWTSRAGDLNEP